MDFASFSLAELWDQFKINGHGGSAFMPTLLVTGGCGFIGANFIRWQLATYSDQKIVNVDKLTYAGNPENLADVAFDSRYVFKLGDIGDREFVDGVLRAE